MKIRVILTILGAFLFVQTAQAAAPILSGSYAVTLTDTCQAAIGTMTNPRTGNVEALETFTTGKLSQTVGTLTFDPATQTAQLSATMIKGSLLIVRGIPGGSHMATSTESGSTAYSNTDSTLVIESQTYSAAYGNIVAGVAQYVTFVGSKSPQCVERGVAVHE